MENNFTIAKDTLLIDFHNGVVFNSTWRIPVYCRSALDVLITGFQNSLMTATVIYKTLTVVNTAFMSVSYSTESI